MYICIYFYIIYNCIIFFSERIDKKKLFRIARKNALSLVQQGVLPVGSVKKDSLANLPSKTVDELTGKVWLKYFYYKNCAVIININKNSRINGF